MGKVHVGDLLRIGHKLWYRIGCGPGMPGPYGVAGGGWWYRQGAQAACMPPLRIIRLVGGYRKGYGRGKYLLAHRAEKLYTDTIIMYGWNEP